MRSSEIVDQLLEGKNWAERLISEASVHRPHRGQIWVASFTGVEGQQWRSTGTSDHSQALIRAREFEGSARAERARTADDARQLSRQLRVPRQLGLTQREVALLMGLSERALRTIEKRALRKLAQH